MPIGWWIVLVFSWAITVSAGWGAYRLLVRNGRLLLQLREMQERLQSTFAPGRVGLPARCVLHDFDLPDLSGKRVTLSQWQGRRVLLIYVDPECVFSQAMLPDLAAHLRSAPPDAPIPIVVTTGDPHRNRRLFAHHGIDCPVLLQEDMELADLHAVAATPLAYLVDEQALTSGHPIAGAEAILRLLGGAAEPGQSDIYGRAVTRRFVRPRGDSLMEYRGLPVGTPAPDFLLPGLDGEPISLGDRRGLRTLLVFLDPGCLPCRELLPDLERTSRETRNLRLLIVSRGSFQSNRELAAALGLTIPVGIQRYWDTSRTYRVMATPVAYLIDERGTIACDAAFGRDAILDLLADIVELKEVMAAV